MNGIRFNQVFIALLVISALCAFVIPAHITNRVRTHFTLLFYPIAKPANVIGAALHRRTFPEKPIDDGASDPNQPRAETNLLQENQELRVLVGSLKGQIAHLTEQEAQRESVGELRQRCEPFSVMGPVADLSARELLHIAGTTGQGLKDGQAVLYGGASGGGIAGRIERASMGGAMVRLITDRGFSLTVSFARFVTNETTGKLDFVRIAGPTVLATGDGRGSMWIRTLTLQQKEQAGIKEGDWAIVEDSDWPAVKWYRLGRVKSITTYASGPGFAELRVEPPTRLTDLKEVLVLTK